MSAATEITIRGVTYPSQSAAARALNTQQSNIHRALAAGTLDTVGLAQTSSDCVPVKVNGRVFPSAAAASRVLNVSPSQIKLLRKKASLANGQFEHPDLGVVEPLR